jgi:hypothetical protein
VSGLASVMTRHPVSTSRVVGAAVIATRRRRLASMELWQRSMIGLARSGRARSWAERAPGARQAAARFVGGESVRAGVATARRLRDAYGITASLF